MNVSEWMRTYYKPNRFRNEPGFNADREQRLIADRENDMREMGYTLISHYDSVTGRSEYLGRIPSYVSDFASVGLTELTQARPEKHHPSCSEWPEEKPWMESSL